MSDHYFAANPASQLSYEPVHVRAWGLELDLLSATGLFSHRRLDLGTSVLLRSATPDPAARVVLDLGCGWGPIAALLARTLPHAAVWAVDVNERAIDVTNQNARRLDAVDRLRATTPDGVPDDVQFDEIWSNPPIRVGKDALHALLLRWLPRLAPDGRAVLVVGRNLGADSLQRWLIDQGWQCDRIASAKGFRVFDVRRP